MKNSNLTHDDEQWVKNQIKKACKQETSKPIPDKGLYKLCEASQDGSLKKMFKKLKPKKIEKFNIIPQGDIKDDDYVSIKSVNLVNLVNTINKIIDRVNEIN